ncbi:hypothetical protein BT96DRAFT_1013344 [Gymnopus androsaceus JB14]|uniref:Homeobox domain-containing protein n=1 Tax=Gymnopus androsaceus JB14 TaxID=1447944 RepID=A0A6A4IDQ3_9AGAR|nr:hypothetical protein BT96DRAFT_1013344 [Gymnopus androsaceus JB14]
MNSAPSLDGEKKRLTAEGAEICFSSKVSPTPTKEQAEEIVRTVRAIPGLEWYNIDRMRTWFTNQRSNTKKAESKSKPAQAQEGPSKLTIKIPKTDGVADPSSAASSAVPSSSTHGRKRKSTKMLTKYPSIKASHVEQLSVLVESIPSYPPSEKLVAAWAKLLKATPEDVRRWAMDKVEAEGISGTDPLAPSVSSEPVERRAAVAIDSDSEDEPLMMHTPIPSQASSVSTLVTPTYPVHPLPPPHPVRHVPPREQLLLAIHNSDTFRVFVSTPHSRVIDRSSTNSLRRTRL